MNIINVHTNVDIYNFEMASRITQKILLRSTDFKTRGQTGIHILLLT